MERSEDGSREDRALARRLFEVGLAAADPAAAVRGALASDPPDGGGGAIVLAVGKAARRMLDGAAGWIAGLPEPPLVLAVTNRENAGASSAELDGRPLGSTDAASRDPTVLDEPRPAAGEDESPEADARVRVARPLRLGAAPVAPGSALVVAGHPVPDAGGLRASRMVEAAACEAGGGTRLLLLLSGGASAMLPAPAEGLTLEDEAATARLLLASGAPIERMNLVRQHLSTLKGGGLARLAAPAEVTALILSDVVGDDLGAIGSGPTAPPLGTRAEARALCRDLGLWDRLPGAVRARLSSDEPPAPTPEADNRIVGSNALSLAAMGRACPEARVHAEPLVGDVADAAARHPGPPARPAPPGRRDHGARDGPGPRRPQPGAGAEGGAGDARPLHLPQRRHRRPRRPHRRRGRRGGPRHGRAHPGGGPRPRGAAGRTTTRIGR